MPDVIERSSPSGFPIATTESPTRTAIRVPELERRQRARLRLHLQDGDIGGRIAADDLRSEALVVRKAHLDALRALNDVVVRDDVAGLVDHEAGAERLLRLGRRAAEAERVEEGIRLYRDAPRRRDLHDAGRGACVDVVNREGLRCVGKRRDAGRPSRRSIDHLANGCRRAPRLPVAATTPTAIAAPAAPAPTSAVPCRANCRTPSFQPRLC